MQLDLICLAKVAVMNLITAVFKGDVRQAMIYVDMGGIDLNEQAEKLLKIIENN